MKSSRNFIIILLLFFSYADISCSKHEYEVDDIQEEDTVWIPQTIYDTIYKDTVIHDTIVKDRFVHDTIYIDSLIHDTIVVDNILNDTIIIDSIIHDTIIIEHGLDKIRVAQWNLGHFALGKASSTKIKYDQYQLMQQKWIEAINSINADIFCCCEFCENFVNSDGNHSTIKARDALFSQYKFAYIGTRPNTLSYMQTAIFSRLPVRNIKQKVFNQAQIKDRYFQYGDLNINGKTVKIVATHLDFTQASKKNYRVEQIHELIDFFSSDPYVIICADWNASPANYDILVEEGYSMANHGSIGDVKTYPAGNNPLWVLDNIVCKGFDISSIGFINDATLTDHMAIYADFSIIE